MGEFCYIVCGEGREEWLSGGKGGSTAEHVFTELVLPFGARKRVVAHAPE